MEINKEISEDTIVGLSLKTVGMIIGGAVIVSLGYFDLKAGAGGKRIACASHQSH